MPSETLLHVSFRAEGVPPPFSASLSVIMKHMEFVTGRTSTQLAIENEQFWKLYGINEITLSELAGRAQGTRQQQTAPID